MASQDNDNSTWTVTNDDGEPSDAAISALARLLLAVVDTPDTPDTPPAAAPVASVSIFAAQER